uniref:Uncharacterized protein n=1 Tax=Arundo donax TaxID=35708 RepID=A0A0A8Z838_ARUDO
MFTIKKMIITKKPVLNCYVVFQELTTSTFL